MHSTATGALGTVFVARYAEANAGTTDACELYVEPSGLHANAVQLGISAERVRRQMGYVAAFLARRIVL